MNSGILISGTLDNPGNSCFLDNRGFSAQANNNGHQIWILQVTLQ